MPPLEVYLPWHMVLQNRIIRGGLSALGLPLVLRSAPYPDASVLRDSPWRGSTTTSACASVLAYISPAMMPVDHVRCRMSPLGCKIRSSCRISLRQPHRQTPVCGSVVHSRNLLSPLPSMPARNERVQGYRKEDQRKARHTHRFLTSGLGFITPSWMLECSVSYASPNRLDNYGR